MADGVATATAIDTDAATSQTHGRPLASAFHRGRLRLVPIEGSASDEVFEIEVELARPDARLTLGDLRRAAIAHTEANCLEEAHRLWAAVALAAASMEAPQLEELARQRVQECRRPAGACRSGGSGAGDPQAQVDRVAEQFRRSQVRYDYLAIAADRGAGLTAAQTAVLHGCSLRTVARAVDFAAQRHDLLGAHPHFATRLAEDVDPALLAAQYGVDTSVMRWILAVGHDRRRR